MCCSTVRRLSLGRPGQVCGRGHHGPHCQGQDGGAEGHQEGDGSGQHRGGPGHKQVRGTAGSGARPGAGKGALAPAHPSSLRVSPPQRQQVSLLAQRLSGGPAVSEMQNHLLAGSGQVSGALGGRTGVPLGLHGGPLGAAWLGAQDPARQEPLWPRWVCGSLGRWGLWRGDRGALGMGHGMCP